MHKDPGEVFKAVLQVMAEMSAIGKNQKVVSGPARFNYRGIDDLYNELQKHMAKAGVFTAPSIVTYDIQTIQSRSGTGGRHVTAEYKFTFWGRDGSHFSVTQMGEAVDYGDKAFNKSASIAHKYALLQVFCIPTEEEKDPDARTHELKPKKPAFKLDPKEQAKSTILGLLGKNTKGLTEAQKKDYLKLKLRIEAWDEVDKYNQDELNEIIQDLNTEASK